MQIPGSGSSASEPSVLVSRCNSRRPTYAPRQWLEPLPAAGARRPDVDQQARCYLPVLRAGEGRSAAGEATSLLCGRRLLPLGVVGAEHQRCWTWVSSPSGCNCNTNPTPARGPGAYPSDLGRTVMPIRHNHPSNTGSDRFRSPPHPRRKIRVTGRGGAFSASIGCLPTPANYTARS